MSMMCSSGKVTYTERRLAKHAARTIKTMGRKNLGCGKSMGRLRPYRCRECGWWHLASVAQVKGRSK